MKKWYQIQNPEIFQGNLDKEEYYEGWYFKLVDAEYENIISFIPTIALNKAQNSSYPFIQVFDGKNSKATTFPYNLKDFKASSSTLDFRIGKNRFTKQGIHLKMESDNHYINGDLTFSNLTEIPYSFFSPGIMGPFSFIPFLSTYHGIVSMNHQISGYLEFDERQINFTKGSKGYIEKDWGKTFPSAWVWMQTNHFKRKNRSFMLSIAKVPFLKRSFLGFLSVLWDDGKFYKFTTYSRAKIKSLSVGRKKVSIILEDRNFLLSVKGNQGKSTLLKAPSRGLMTGDCYESLMSEINVTLYEKKKTHLGKIIFKDKGINAGLEIMNPKLLKID